MTNIILAIIKFLNGIIDFLLPDKIFINDIFTNFASYFDFFVDFLVTANYFVPMHTIFLCLNFMLSIRVIKFTIFIYNWFIRAILDVIP